MFSRMERKPKRLLTRSRLKRADMLGKNIKDFDDDEMEGMIADEELKLKGDQLETILYSVLAFEGLTYLAEL